MRILDGHRRPIRALVYAPGDATLLASASDDRTVRLWNPLTGEERATLTGHHDGVLSLAFSPDGGRLVSGGRDCALILWSQADGRPLFTLDRLFGPVWSVAFEADGASLLAVPRQPAVGVVCRLMRWRPGEGFQLLEAGQYLPRCVATTSDGWGIAVASTDRSVRLWNSAQRWWARVPQSIGALAFAPVSDRRWLALAYHKFAEVWDVMTGQRVALCKGHRAQVHALAFSPDGRRLLTGSSDCTVRLWEAESGRLLQSTDWKVGHVYAVAFSPDGMTAAAGGAKPGLVIWDVE